MAVKLIQILFILLMGSCASVDYTKFKSTKETAVPGTQVKRGESTIELYNGEIKVGDDFNSYLADLEAEKISSITIVNIVPSIDTAVCEAQNHILGESKLIHPGVKLMNISRDTSMAQARFQQEAKLTNITFLSDFKFGAFGKKSGLLMKGNELLARAVLVVDENGKIVHLQISDDITLLPDINTAIEKANQLAKKM